MVYGKDGLDEISLGAATLIGELKDGKVREYEIHPEDFGIAMVGTRAFRVDNPEQSKQIVLGGMGTLIGPVAGAVALLIFEEILAGWTTHWMIVVGPAIVLIVLTAQKGLYGFLVDRTPRRTSRGGR